MKMLTGLLPATEGEANSAESQNPPFCDYGPARRSPDRRDDHNSGEIPRYRCCVIKGEISNGRVATETS
jgi:hypothetical protein